MQPQVRRVIQVQGLPKGVIQVQGRAIQVPGSGSCPSWLQTARAIWRAGGARAFYDGIAAEYIKVVPVGVGLTMILLLERLSLMKRNHAFLAGHGCRVPDL